MPSSACQTCARSEEHTSELQSHSHLVCRLLLEKKTCGGVVRPRSAWASAVPGTSATVCGRAPLSVGVHPPGAWHRRDARWPCQEVFFFNDTAPPEIYPLSLIEALPI